MDAAFAPVVAAARARITETFGAARRHGAYLYGSIPRGTARPGLSDLDLLLALHQEPTAADRAEARTLKAALDESFPQVNGVGMLLFSTGTLLSKWSATTWASWSPAGAPPLTGPDLALVLPSWRAQVTDADRLALSRVIARRLVRTGFTLVMPRWGGWTSDLGQAAQLFNSYYPERAGQMRLAAEYTAVHGVKAPR